MVRKFIIPAIIIVIFLTTILATAMRISGRGTTENGILNPHELFATEEAYQEYLASASFAGVRFTRHTIRPGDNFWKIARDHDIDIDTLIAANPFWKSLNAVTGQVIMIPSIKGSVQFTQSATTDEEFREIFESGDLAILSERKPLRERLGFGGDKRPYRAVFIIDGKPSELIMTESMAADFTLREKFRSPLGGRFSSYFGKRVHPIFNVNGFHNGLDIAARHGTPVGAARAGTVTAAGWMGGYGKAVIINHGEGYKTLYGHLSSINVRSGQQIRAGQFVGRVGSTGYSTGPHLHFTLWHGEKLINPMKVLW